MRKNYFFLILIISVLSCSDIVSKQKVSIPMAGNYFEIPSTTNNTKTYELYFASSESTKANVFIETKDVCRPSEFDVKYESKSIKLQFDASTSMFEMRNMQLKKGYNKIVVSTECVNFNPANGILHVDAQSDVSFNFVRDNENHRYYFGRRGPSVHLSYFMPEDVDVKWFYNELSVDKGDDPIGSYFMANGFGEGYFGMQVNSASERRILFSVWSPYVTDNPSEIPDSEKIILLRKGKDVVTGEFGNEGSGGQSFMRYNWEAGQTYRFLNSVEPDGKGNSIYTAYFFDNKSNKWILIASFKRPKTNTWYKRAHSFLENFDTKRGNVSRKVKCGNQWVCDTNGQWHELNRARFTGDDIAKVAYRLDYDGGVEDDHFFMKNTGFFVTQTQLNTVFERVKRGKKPDVNFDELP